VLTLSVLGILAGAAASLLGKKLVDGFLFQVQPLGLSTFVTVTLTLLLVSIVARPGYSASVDPMRTLHEQ
jgi:hypothetical protein